MDTNEKTSTAGASKEAPASSPGSQATLPPIIASTPTPEIPKRGRGRPRGSKTRGGKRAPTPAPIADAPDMSDIQKAAAGAPPEAGDAIPGAATPSENATLETAIGLIQLILVFAGDEEGVLTANEKLMLRPPLERVLRKYEIGADVLPAEVELIFAVAGIVIERIKRGGKTATTFARVKAWFVSKLFARQGARVGATMRNEVPTDLVDKLQQQVSRLQNELAAKTPPTVSANAQP